jgi:hypothetical protein
LSQSLVGSISIDPGATLIALYKYQFPIAIGFIATAVAIDRRRAKWVLTLLASATTVSAIELIAHDVSKLTFLRNIGDIGTRTSVTVAVALGVIFTAAAAIRTFEQYETRSGRTHAIGFVFVFAGCLTAFATCWFALFYSATRQTIFSAACGLSILASIVAIRRLGLGSWGTTGVAASVIIALAPIRPEIRANDLTLALAQDVPAALISVTERIIADNVWIGTGAGTFSAIFPIYREADAVIRDLKAPTAAAQIAIELGYPALWVTVIIALGIAISLMRGAVGRGRDSFYPAAGAGCLVTLTLQSFGGGGLFTTAVSILAATVLGLALAQRVSRTGASP